ncbi:MAG: host attachment protein [Pseudomonadota bacterium]|jgi:protein required for attachment to host cells
MSSTIGVIVCNHSRARLFKANALSLVSELVDQVNPAARLREQDLTTDAPGKYQGGGSGGQQHVEGHRTSAHDKAADRFARDIAAALDQAVTAHGLDRLYVVAEPDMLGRLRKALSESCRSLVQAEIGKDVVARTPTEIRDFLPVPL